MVKEKALKPKSLAKFQLYFNIFLGSIITAAGINLFLVPNKIAPGGVSGIATVLYYLTNGVLPVGLTMLAFDIPLYIIGYRFIGRKFIFRTMYSSVVLSVLIDLSKPYFNILSEKYFSSAATPENLIIYAIFGGVFVGLGLGIVFRAGATTGGTDLAAKIVHHFTPNLSVGNILLCIDGAVVIFAAIAFNSITIGLYAIVTIFTMTKVIDALLEGVNFSKCVYIISEKSDLITDKILNNLDRGVTALKGTGMYTKSEKEVLMCVLDRSQIPQLKQMVQEIDERAFIILTDVREVLGEGFKDGKHEI